MQERLQSELEEQNNLLKESMDKPNIREICCVFTGISCSILKVSKFTEAC